MKEQDYLIKKFVRATTAGEAMSKDKDTPVHEVYLVADKPEGTAQADAVGFKVVPIEE